MPELMGLENMVRTKSPEWHRRSRMPVMTALEQPYDARILTEHLYISACIDAGTWTPQLDGIGPIHFVMEGMAARWLDDYAEKSGGLMPPLNLLHNKFPSIVYVAGVNKQWATASLHSEDRQRMVKQFLLKAANKVDDDYEGVLKDMHRISSLSTFQYDDSEQFGDILAEDNAKRLPSLYPAIENCGGIREGDYVLLTARTSVGKTYRLLQHAVSMAEGGNDVLYFSLEMAAWKCAMRLYPMLFGSESLEWDAKKRQSAARDWQDNLGIRFSFFDQTKGDITPSSIARRVQGGEVIFIDHAGIMKSDKGERMLTDHSIAGQTSNAIAELKNRMAVTAFMGAQANRATGNDKVPDDMSIALSDSYGQDADLGISLMRSQRDLPLTVNQVFKSRNGSITEGRWFTRFRPDIGDYSVMDVDDAIEIINSFERANYERD